MRSCMGINISGTDRTAPRAAGRPPRRAAWAAGLLGLLIGTAPAAALAGNGRLPDTASPLRYDLTVIPDAKALTFSGTVHIDLDVATATRTLTLNAENLSLDTVTIDGTAPVGTTQDKAEQTATFTAAKPLSPGHHILDIAYRGTIEKTARGLFHLDYTAANGTPARMLLTQFEAGEARRFLPCWDEPGVKAIYTVSVATPSGQTSLSNMPVRSTEAMSDGRTLVHFEATPRMSSYLLFLGMGDIERISTQVGPTEIGVVTRRGAVEKGRYALESAAAILTKYNEYFGTPYPLPKMDMIAAPGAGGFGAMENWGAIMYFEQDLLLDPKVSTQADRQTVFEVVAHEMAHQWFGNLVTMAWWDDLWLNEGFASWMATKVTDMLHPDWHPWLETFPGRQTAMTLDASASTHPIIQPINSVAEADEAFDAITYQKGQAVIRMIEATVGEDVFREGVRRYIKRHAFGNAVTRDLWKAVEDAGGKGVLRIAGDFTTKPGLPLVSVDVGACAGGATPVTLRQSRFSTAGKIPPVVHQRASSLRSGDGLWAIPVVLDKATGEDGGAPATTLLTAATGKAAVRGCGPVLVNRGQTSYFRTAYTPAAFHALLGRIGDVAAIDQLGLLSDSAALGEQGVMPLSDNLELIRALKPDADPQVWQQAAVRLQQLDGYYSDRPQDKAGRAALRAFGRATLTPVLAHIGWDARPSESDAVSLLRATLIGTLGLFDDPGVLAESWRRLNAAAREPMLLPAAIRIAVLEVAARQADEEDFEHLHALAKQTTDPLERRQMYMVLAAVRDPALVDKALALSLTDEVATTTTPSMIQRLATADPDRAWRFTMDHVDDIQGRLDQMQRYEFAASIASRATRTERIGDLNHYAEAHVPANGRQGIAKATDTITQRARVVTERLPAVDAWLAKATGQMP